MQKHTRICIALGWVLASLPGTLGAAVVITLPGATEDYESQLLTFSGGIPSTEAVRATTESLRVFSEPLGDGAALRQGRPIFQFDLSTLAALTDDHPVVGSAVLRLTLLDVSESPAFGVEAWGRGDNLANPIAVGDPGDGGQFGASAYGPLGGGSFVPDSASTPREVSLDIGSYMDARYQEYLLGGDSWVLIRLQADEALTLGSAPDVTYSFASADHPTSAFRP